jgi:hypothetical protein
MSELINTKQYLDLEGLQHLLAKLEDAYRIPPHPTGKSKELGAYRVKVDYNGHVIETDELKADHIGAATPDDIGKADITVKIGDLTQSFNVNEADAKTLTFTKDDLRSQLGITGAMHFAGTTTTALTDSATTNPIKVNSKDYTAIAGDVVLYSGKEFI